MNVSECLDQLKNFTLVVTPKPILTYLINMVSVHRFLPPYSSIILKVVATITISHD